MRIHNEKGGAALGFILFASVSAAFLAGNLNTILDTLGERKKSFRVNSELDSYVRGVVTYTKYALKERWCMNNSWERSDDCGANMDEILSNPLNLERLLWSNAATNDIKVLYEGVYGEVMSFDPNLEKVELTVSAQDLDSLGNEHPINLSLSPALKNCLKSTTIKLERAANSILYATGDEKYIDITVKGQLLEEKRCEQYEGNPFGQSLVALFPRTLNQFALIKGSDLNFASFRGSEKSKGVNFHGPIYVDNDVILPRSKYAPVGIYSNIYIGRGDLKYGAKRFSPDTFGSLEDQMYSSIDTVKAMKGSVVFESSIDEGLAVLFGEDYDVDTSFQIMCQNWKALFSEFDKTADSRLFVRKQSDGFKLGISKTSLEIPNQFREHDAGGDSTNGYVRVVNGAGFLKVSGATLKDRPVIKLEVSANGIEGSAHLGTSTSLEIDLFKDNGVETESRKLVNGEPAYNVNFTKVIDGNSIENTVKKIESSCKDLKDEFKGKRKVSNSKCKLVINDYEEESNSCSDLKKKDKEDKCNNLNKQIDDEYVIFETKKSDLEEKLKDYKQDPAPIITLDTAAASVTNELIFKVEVKSSELFNEDLYKGINSVDIKFYAFDVTGTSGSDRGNGNGLNDTARPNKLTISITRNKDGEYEGYEILKADATKIQSKWELMRIKDGISNEPPHIPEDASAEVPKYTSQIYLPTDGIDYKMRDRLEEECSNEHADFHEWDVSFTKNTVHSWLYDVGSAGVTLTGKMEIIKEKEFDYEQMNPNATSGVLIAPTSSITEKCIINKDIQYLFGFFTCKELVIQGRKTPLKIIGTLITNKLTINKTAVDNGVDFYTMWHPVAVNFLRERGWLRAKDSENENISCPKDTTVWDKNLTRLEQENLTSCSPINFVLEGVNNYNWTTIDPEIGLPETGGLVTRSKISNRYRRFKIKTMWTRTGVEK